MADKKDKLLVAAIDFGTTFSGYAFSFKHDYKTDPLRISTNQNWVAGSRGLVSLKAPTCVLLDSKKEFLAFGYEAEDMYSELALDDNHFDYYFFKRFKMVLHDTRVSIVNWEFQISSHLNVFKKYFRGQYGKVPNEYRLSFDLIHSSIKRSNLVYNQ